ncbi:MAG: membrane protein [Mycobacteriales bacterium]
MRLTRRAAMFLLLVAAWSWLIWPTFLRNVAADPRSFAAGRPTGFLVVHALLAAVSLGLGTAVGVLGWRGWRAAR